jgi:hypothetical protein
MPDLAQPIRVVHLAGAEQVSIELARVLCANQLAVLSDPSQRALLGVETELCVHCDKPIVEFESRWMHADEDGVPLPSGRGCRSASFDRYGNDGWDETLGKSWNARPERNTAARKAVARRRRPTWADEP